MPKTQNPEVHSAKKRLATAGLLAAGLFLTGIISICAFASQNTRHVAYWEYQSESRQFEVCWNSSYSGPYPEWLDGLTAMSIRWDNGPPDKNPPSSLLHACADWCTNHKLSKIMLLPNKDPQQTERWYLLHRNPDQSEDSSVVTFEGFDTHSFEWLIILDLRHYCQASQTTPISFTARDFSHNPPRLTSIGHSGFIETMPAPTLASFSRTMAPAGLLRSLLLSQSRLTSCASKTIIQR